MNVFLKRAVTCLIVSTLTACAVGSAAYAQESSDQPLYAATELVDDTAEDEADDQEQEQAEPISMYRLYNGFTSEHFYTAAQDEKDALVDVGWFYEGVGWLAPEESSTPVYRLYNSYAGDHHYTTSAPERDALVEEGWIDEGIGWYSDDAETTPVFRQYNPYAKAGAHNFCTSEEERDGVVAAGWKDEGCAWYACGPGWSERMSWYSKTHLLAILSCSGSSTEITPGYCTTLDPDRVQNLQNLLNTPTTIAFAAINACTGEAVFRCADWRFYGASTVKAPFCASLCKYNAPGVTGWENTMYGVITWSSNEGFDSLVGAYGTFYERAFAHESAVDIQFPYGGGYVDFTPVELCKMWVSIRDYIVSDSINVNLFKGLFGNGAYYKEGWMYEGMLGGQLYHVAGIDGDVVYAVMSRYQYPDRQLWTVKNAVVAAVS